MSESDFYSVRCEHCECSFAPETKSCVHCGAPLRGGLMAALRTASGEPAEEDLPRSGGSKLWVVMAMFAMGASMLRQCGG